MMMISAITPPPIYMVNAPPPCSLPQEVGHPRVDRAPQAFMRVVTSESGAAYPSPRPSNASVPRA